MRAHVLIVLSMLGATSACSREENTGGAGSPCAGDFNCKNGFLCEGAICIPKEIAEKARAASSAATPAATQASAPPVPATAAPTATAAAVDEGPIPLIPKTRSNPPQGTEWSQGKEVNTQNIHSQPDKCSMKVLREWLNVICRDDYVGYEKMENFGNKFDDYYESIDPGRVVSFVLRLKEGKPQAVRICAPDKRASLFVNWPKGADKPAHIALGKGPACDGSAWGAYLKKKTDTKTPEKKSDK